MKEQIAERLRALQSEYEAGQKMLAELDARRASLTTAMLRIEGAIQVLREITGEADPPAAGPNGSTPGPPNG
jgi:predicted nuclease with TOPRIM domain